MGCEKMLFVHEYKMENLRYVHVAGQHTHTSNHQGPGNKLESNFGHKLSRQLHQLGRAILELAGRAPALPLSPANITVLARCGGLWLVYGW